MHTSCSRWRTWCKSTAVVLATVLYVAIPIHTAALAVPPAPAQAPVLDQAKVLDPGTETRIANKVIDYEKQTGNQIAVLTIPSLDGEDIAGYANRVAREWGVGDKKANNGVLLLAAINDRTVRIEVGRGLEPMLTDLQSNLIIRQEITPFYKQGDYNRGTENGVDAIVRVIGGERLSEPRSKSLPIDGGIVAPLLYFAFVPLAYLGSYLARSRSWWLGGVLGAMPGGVIALSHVVPGLLTLGVGVFIGLVLDYLLSKNYRERKASGDDTGFWGSGGGFFGGTGGSSSGGGWGGFGGGGFGGGGSSGRW